MTRDEILAAVRDGKSLSGVNLYGVNLRGVNLRGANLYGVNLHGANLYGVNLRGVNLYGVNLYGVNLHGANLYGAKIGEHVLVRLVGRAWRTRDSYEFLAFATEAGPLLIRAGCRTFTLEQYRDHVRASYLDEPKGRETMAILDHFERVAVIAD